MLSNAIMEETTQVNIRLPKSLLKDLDIIAANMRINRNEWLKVAISNSIFEEKRKIVYDLENRFILGRISEEDYYKSTGQKAVEALKELRAREEKFGISGKLSVRRFLQEISKKYKV